MLFLINVRRTRRNNIKTDKNNTLAFGTTLTKIYVLDTSTIVYHPYCFKSFKKNMVIIPIPVLEELDKLKTYSDETGKNARTFLRTIDQLIKGSKEGIHNGIKLEDDVILKIDTNLVHNDTLGSPLYGDNRILSYLLQAQQTTKKKVILVSKDIGLRVRANSYGILAEDYTKDTYTINDTHQGYKSIEITDDEINDFYKNGMLELPDDLIKELNLKANNFVELKDYNSNDVGFGRFNSKSKSVKTLNRTKSLFGIVPKNLEQQFAMDLLLDDDVKLVTLAGIAGSGKTLLSVGAGLHNILEKSGRKYEKLMIMKPIISVGKDLGTLPGDKSEKLNPYLASYYDNINFLMKNSRQNKSNKSSSMDPYLSLMVENGTIEIEAVSYLRGRSLPNSFIIIDEIQNLSMHELKTIVTRIGEGSKLVLIGDESQIDHPSLSSGSNALATAINKFTDYQIAGNVIMTKGERSELASLAAEIL